MRAHVHVWEGCNASTVGLRLCIMCIQVGPAQRSAQLDDQG